MLKAFSLFFFVFTILNFPLPAHADRGHVPLSLNADVIALDLLEDLLDQEHLLDDFEVEEIQAEEDDDVVIDLQAGLKIGLTSLVVQGLFLLYATGHI